MLYSPLTFRSGRGHRSPPRTLQFLQGVAESRACIVALRRRLAMLLTSLIVCAMLSPFSVGASPLTHADAVAQVSRDGPHAGEPNTFLSGAGQPRPVPLSLVRLSVVDDDTNTQVAELFQLQAAFHRAASVHNPSGLDSSDAIGQRIVDMLSLWTDDGSLTLMIVSPARPFLGKGEPGSASCAPGSNTLCDFFTNVAGSFQPGNRFVSLAPAYKTHFELHGNTASVYFECHYFDAATWQDKSHVAFDGTAERVNGRWLLAHADAPGMGVPYP
jgi:hypothetical protein